MAFRNPIRWNRWDLLPNSPSPQVEVDIVVSHFNQHEALKLSLHALAEQSYPPELINVIVADDGSAEAPTVPQSHPFGSYEVALQQDQGFRLAAVRNLGASRGTSPVIIFLDCDVIPSRGWLEKHMIWHRKSQEAVTFGKTLYVDSDTVSFENQTGRAPTHVLGHLLRTNNFLSGHDDLFYAAAGGNLGVSRALFVECGGFDEDFSEWGGEDLDLTFRLFTVGADLIPAKEAVAYHLGPGTSQSSGPSEQRTYLGHHISHRSLSVPEQGRQTADIQIDTSLLDEPQRTKLAEQLSKSLDTQRFKLVTGKHFPDLDAHSPLQIKTSTSSLPINQIDRLVAALGGQFAVFEFDDGTQVVTTRSALKTQRQTASTSLYSIAKLYGQLTCTLEKVQAIDSTESSTSASRDRLRSVLDSTPGQVQTTVSPLLRRGYAALVQIRRLALIHKIKART